MIKTFTGPMFSGKTTALLSTYFDMWLEFDRETIGFDENFLNVSNYVSQNNISKLK